MMLLRHCALTLLFFSASLSAAEDSLLSKQRLFIKPERCLKHHSAEEMASKFTQLYFSNGSVQDKAADGKIWLNEFATVSTPGLMDEIGIAEWSTLQADLHAINKRLLDIATYNDLIDKNKRISVVYVLNHKRYSAFEETGFKKGDEAFKKQVRRYVDSSESCSMWQRDWRVADRTFNQILLYVSVKLDQNKKAVNREEITNCFVQTSLKELGVQNIDQGNDFSLTDHTKGVRILSNYAEWLLWTAMHIRYSKVEIADKAALMAMLTNYFNQECQ